MRARAHVSSLGNQKPMHQKAGTRVNMTCVCRCTGSRSHRFFFFYIGWHTASHKRIPPKTATSGPSEHPEAERRGGEAADCARSTSFDLNVMRCMRITKQYTRKRHIHRSPYTADTVSLCWQQETRRDLSMSKIFQEVQSELNDEWNTECTITVFNTFCVLEYVLYIRIHLARRNDTLYI